MISSATPRSLRASASASRLSTTFETDGDGTRSCRRTSPAVARIEPPADRPTSRARGETFYLAGTRGLAKSWRDRARDNLAAIRLAARSRPISVPPRADEQAQLIRFTGFGASELANGVFRRPGEDEFRDGWEEIGAATGVGGRRGGLRLARPLHPVRPFHARIHRARGLGGVARLGFRGGRVLEPGIGTGLFPALMPESLRAACHVTGVELDPITARIAGLLQPRATIINEDFARTELRQHFDLAIGNPPFSDRTVRSDRAFRVARPCGCTIISSSRRSTG